MRCGCCSTACKLDVAIEGNSSFKVLGNKCVRGKEHTINYLLKRKTKKYALNGLGEVLQSYGITLVDVIDDEFILGSSERSNFRVVVRDDRNQKFILEEISQKQVSKRLSISKIIDKFAKLDLQVNPYIKTKLNEYVSEVNDGFWQVSVYLDSVVLHRQTYFNDAWRGELLAKFVADIQKVGADSGHDLERFDFKQFINKLVADIELNEPEVFKHLQPVINFVVEHFYPVIDKVPSVFSHGDLHALNVLWGKDCMISVIDWEFCGKKPCLYDAALIIGCVGSEDPAARTSPFVKQFVTTLKEQKVFTDEVFELLPYFVLAVRFGWMSEWLRRNDIEMIEFELYYMNLLLQEIGSE